MACEAKDFHFKLILTWKQFLSDINRERSAQPLVHRDLFPVEPDPRPLPHPAELETIAFPLLLRGLKGFAIMTSAIEPSWIVRRNIVLVPKLAPFHRLPRMRNSHCPWSLLPFEAKLPGTVQGKFACATDSPWFSQSQGRISPN